MLLLNPQRHPKISLTLAQIGSLAFILYAHTVVAMKTAQTILHAPSDFDRRHLPSHVAQAVWRGTEVARSSGRTVPTGFKVLDDALPGCGWPTQGLSELLLPQAALCEWRLLAPALPGMLQEKGSKIYLIAPPKTPHAMGLAQLGVAPEQLVWIDAQGPAERLWATEQLIKSEPSGAVLAWLPQARQEQIRRLQVHAHTCDAPVFLVRPEIALRDASSAPLRVSATLGRGWNIDVQIRKRRGSASVDVLHLNAIPSNLDAILPPRLRGLFQPVSLPSKEVSHALGSSHSSTTAGIPH